MDVDIVANECEWCYGVGFYNVNVEVGHPDWGKAIQCGCIGGAYPPDYKPTDPTQYGAEQKPELEASPTKLDDGRWGAVVDGDVSIGDTITITTAGGKSWDVRVSGVVSTVVATEKA